MMIRKLNDLTESKKVKLLFACESGSRAWGFPSPDSDYDVRFVYTHPLEWYLGVNEKKDSIMLLEGDFDAVGWELRKKLRLLKKSNVPALEHLFSPIYYTKVTPQLEELKEIAKDCFSPIACMFHYLSMSKKYEEKINEEAVKLKSVFYALRTALAGKWILEYGLMPPVRFEKMLELLRDEEVSKIREMIILKSNENEDYLFKDSGDTTRLIKELNANNTKYAKSLAAGKPDGERIDVFLYKNILK